MGDQSNCKYATATEDIDIHAPAPRSHCVLNKYHINSSSQKSQHLETVKLHQEYG